MNINVKDAAPSFRGEGLALVNVKSDASLRQTSVRGGIAKLASQAINFAIRLLFIAILSRLIQPADFGLFTMATVFVGVFQVVTGGGFAQAAVQNKEVSDGQLYYLFVFNIVLSIVVSAICYVLSIFASSLFQDARVTGLVLALVPAFILTSVGAVPVAVLQRQMRFTALAYLEVLSGLLSCLLGVAMAMMGYGYWALVASAVALPAIYSLGAWGISGWVPRRPPSARGVVPMVTMGTTVIVNGIVIYFAYNSEKMLLGRFWGADALGFYGRASQLSTLPVGQLNQALGPVAFAALSKMQDEPVRLKRYFLDFFYLTNCASAPLSLFFLFFAPEVIGTILGERWAGATDAFRLLAPSVLFLGVMNAPAPLLFALGLQKRSLAIALAIAALCILAYLIGLPYGPSGVSAAYSIALAVWLIPHLIWCLYGTPVRLKEIFLAVAPSFLAGLVGAAVAFGILSAAFTSSPPLVRVALAALIMGGIHLFMLLVVLRQKRRFVELWTEIRAGDGRG